MEREGKTPETHLYYFVSLFTFKLSEFIQNASGPGKRSFDCYIIFIQTNDAWKFRLQEMY